MIATSGDRLLEQAAVMAYCQRLFPAAALVTPNLDEASALLGRAILNREQMLEAGRELLGYYGCAWLIKGGHLRGDYAADLLLHANGTEEWFEAPFVRGVSTHGTGCTYSAAIASELAKGNSLSTAVSIAKRYVTGAVRGCLRWNVGDKSTDALHHFHKH
jgi:hydroxymethylpyrimidine/phosphomethylpyrimidine kinase